MTVSLRARAKCDCKPVKASPSPVAIPNDLERFGRRRRDEETGETIEFGVAGAIASAPAALAGARIEGHRR
jgi:hypothetical protein